MNAPSIDIKDMLVAASLGLTFAVNLFIGNEPPKPNNCVTIFDTMGAAPDTTLDRLSLYNPSIQIRVRNSSYEAGSALIESISQTLHARAQVQQGGTLYSAILVSGGPAMLHWDDNKRVIFIINFNIQRRSL